MDRLNPIRHMCEVSGMSIAALARAVNRDRNSLYNMFHRGTDVMVGSYIDMAEAMGYELVLKGHGEEIVVEHHRQDEE